MYWTVPRSESMLLAKLSIGRIRVPTGCKLCTVLKNKPNKGVEESKNAALLRSEERER
jgi:hypothetical protein